MSDTYKIKVIKTDTGEVVKTLETVTERAAERVERGLNINMNHADYHTVIEPPKDPIMTNPTPHGQVPEALRLANEFKLCNEYDSIPSLNDIAKAAAELRRLHARIAELESQLESSGFTAADMATASAQGFRDGVASLAASAGEPWTGGEEWEALAWHLCAEENGEDACGELIWEGGPTPEPWGDRWMKYESDAKRMIELVRKFVAAPPTAQAGGWTKLPGTLPKPGTPVLLDIGKKYPIRAMWAAKHTVQAADDDTDWGEYDEATDEYWCPEGWYEWNQNEDNHWCVTETPRAWMPLPPTSAEGVEHG